MIRRHLRLGEALLYASLASGPAWADADNAVPVTVQKATVGNVPVFATGIGTVTALNSALIRARVDGTLDSVNFIEGQEVKQGDLLAIIDPRPYLAILDQARAKRTQDEAALVNQKRDLTRYSTLAGQGFASRQTADTQSATVKGGRALIQADDAAIEAAALNVAYTHIVSPIDGRVGLRITNPGNLVHATDTTGIVQVTQLHPIAVLFTLPEESVPEIADSQAHGAAPEVEAVESAGAQRLLGTGTLLTIDSNINTSTGTIQLKARFGNADNRLWPGEFVKARLKLRTLSQVVTVPAEAVQRGQDGLYVYVVGADGKAVQRNVKEFQEQDGVAAIEAGLAEGEQVVVDGQSRVSNGTKVSAHGLAS